VTKENITTLRTLGISVVDPDNGPLACGYSGWGRLAELEVIEDEILRILKANTSLKGKRVLITSGGTLEKIDDIRFIANKSSGKMGAALAESCVLRGAAVTFLKARHSLSPRYKVIEQVFETADELEHLLVQHISNTDICFHVAAVSDYSISHPLTGKTSSTRPLPLELTPKTKILDKIKKHNPHVFLIAFKAEWGITGKKLISAARKRLAASKADMIIANDVSKKDSGFQSDANEVTIISNDGSSCFVPRAAKRVIAKRVVEEVVAHITG
jgi:phosphopantothenoylcysteine decarboxylase/phosphopantothenate--cysteine ligase